MVTFQEAIKFKFFMKILLFQHFFSQVGKPLRHFMHPTQLFQS